MSTGNVVAENVFNKVLPGDKTGLPWEIWQYLLSWMSARDLCRLACVCKTWTDLVASVDGTRWKQLYLACSEWRHPFWPLNTQAEPHSWRLAYRDQYLSTKFWQHRLQRQTQTVSCSLLFKKSLVRKTVHVGPGLEHECLKTALSVINEYDRVVVHPGIYDELFEISSKIPFELVGEGELGSVILVVGIQQVGAAARLSNLVLRAPWFTSFIVMISSGYLQIDSCILEDGMVCAQNPATVHIKFCTFRHATVILQHMNTSVIENCEFSQSDSANVIVEGYPKEERNWTFGFLRERTNAVFSQKRSLHRKRRGLKATTSLTSSTVHSSYTGKSVVTNGGGLPSTGITCQPSDVVSCDPSFSMEDPGASFLHPSYMPGSRLLMFGTDNTGMVGCGDLQSLYHDGSSEVAGVDLQNTPDGVDLNKKAALKSAQEDKATVAAATAAESIQTREIEQGEKENGITKSSPAVKPNSPSVLVSAEIHSNVNFQPRSDVCAKCGLPFKAKRIIAQHALGTVETNRKHFDTAKERKPRALLREDRWKSLVAKTESQVIDSERKGSESENSTHSIKTQSTEQFDGQIDLNSSSPKVSLARYDQTSRSVQFIRESIEVSNEGHSTNARHLICRKKQAWRRQTPDERLEAPADLITHLNSNDTKLKENVSDCVNKNKPESTTDQSCGSKDFDTTQDCIKSSPQEVCKHVPPNWQLFEHSVPLESKIKSNSLQQDTNISIDYVFDKKSRASSSLTVENACEGALFRPGSSREETIGKEAESESMPGASCPENPHQCEQLSDMCSVVQNETDFGQASPCCECDQGRLNTNVSFKCSVSDYPTCRNHDCEGTCQFNLHLNVQQQAVPCPRQQHHDSQLWSQLHCKHYPHHHHHHYHHHHHLQQQPQREPNLPPLHIPVRRSQSQELVGAGSDDDLSILDELADSDDSSDVDDISNHNSSSNNESNNSGTDSDSSSSSFTSSLHFSASDDSFASSEESVIMLPHLREFQPEGHLNQSTTSPRGVQAEVASINSECTRPVPVDVSEDTLMSSYVGQIQGCLIHQCRMNHSKGGLMISLQAHAIVSECDISNVGYGIRCIQNSRAVILKNKIHHCRTSGIFMRLAASGLVAGNDIHSNNEAGIDIRKNADPLVQFNQIHHGKRSGVVVLGSGRGQIKKNDIYRNQEAGVYVLYGGNPTISENYIYEGRAAGVAINAGGRGCIIDNVIRGNQWGGVDIRNGSCPLVAGNSIINGLSDGVVVGLGGRGNIESNFISGNGGCGLWMMAAKKLYIHGNQISNSGHCGIMLLDKSTSAMEGHLGQLLTNVSRRSFSQQDDNLAVQEPRTNWATLQYNNIFNNIGHGVVIEIKEEVRMFYNAVHGNHRDGVLMSQCAPAVLEGNSITSNCGNGVVTSTHDKVQLVGNGIYDNGQHGLICRNSCVVESNDIAGHTQTSVMVEAGADVQLRDNRLCSSPNGMSAVRGEESAVIVAANNRFIIIGGGDFSGCAHLTAENNTLVKTNVSVRKQSRSEFNKTEYLTDPSPRPHIAAPPPSTVIPTHYVTVVTKVTVPSAESCEQGSKFCIIL
ncbi:F-box only protein 10 [Plakobranchus ocellatus]|uniref:F-box only protein 10 n=1 Tax=Plakobranchus ocellatus TaxID=259542 RepID=A0AAV4CUT9_9GAST|nr:F-box only protein 10 [Plakobranchus ocellatus]